jgi:uncharacterized membrane protein
MKPGPSFTLLIIGAILAFAITSQPSFINLHVVGVILMVAGALALRYGMRHRPRRTDVYSEPGHTTYVEASEVREPHDC